MPPNLTTPGTTGPVLAEKARGRFPKTRNQSRAPSSVRTWTGWSASGVRRHDFKHSHMIESTDDARPRFGPRFGWLRVTAAIACLLGVLVPSLIAQAPGRIRQPVFNQIPNPLRDDCLGFLSNMRNVSAYRANAASTWAGMQRVQVSY